MGRQGIILGIPGYLVFRDSRNPLSYGTPRDIPGIPGYLVFRDSRYPPSYGTPKDFPGNSGILSIPGLKESSIIWDTKGHPRNAGILSIPGIKESTKRYSRIPGHQDSRNPLSNGTPRDIPGIPGFKDHMGHQGTAEESWHTYM